MLCLSLNPSFQEGKCYLARLIHEIITVSRKKSGHLEWTLARPPSLWVGGRKAQLSEKKATGLANTFTFVCKPVHLKDCRMIHFNFHFLATAFRVCTNQNSALTVFLFQDLFVKELRFIFKNHICHYVSFWVCTEKNWFLCHWLLHFLIIKRDS